MPHAIDTAPELQEHPHIATVSLQEIVDLADRTVVCHDDIALVNGSAQDMSSIGNLDRALQS